MPRPSTRILSPEIIARAALELVRRTRDFTIPGIAADLGVNPSSLYHHVPGGKAEIIGLMRRELYSRIDLAALREPSQPWQERLEMWVRSYREAFAAVPLSVPILVGAAVDDAPTLRIYEVLFAILADAGVPRERWAAISAMLDAIVLGSAIDASAPVPLWQVEDAEDFPLLTSVHSDDTSQRPLAGLELAVEAAVAQVRRCLEPSVTGGRPGS